MIIKIVDIRKVNLSISCQISKNCFIYFAKLIVILNAIAMGFFAASPDQVSKLGSINDQLDIAFQECEKINKMIVEEKQKQQNQRK